MTFKHKIMKGRKAHPDQINEILRLKQEFGLKYKTLAVVLGVSRFTISHKLTPGNERAHLREEEAIKLFLFFEELREAQARAMYRYQRGETSEVMRRSL